MYKWFLSLRYFREHRIVYFSIAGVAAGIMVMIVVSAVMSGFQRDIRSRIRGVQSDIVVSRVHELLIADYRNVMDDLKAVSGVQGCAPRLEWGVMASRENTSIPRLFTLIGIDPDAENAMGELTPYWNMHDSTEPLFPDLPPSEGIPVRIGEEFILGPGRQHMTTFRSVGGSHTPFEGMFTPVGRFKTGLTEYDALYLFAPLDRVQQYLRLDKGSLARDVVNEIAIKIQPGAGLAQVKDGIARMLESKYGKTYVATTWEEARATFLTAVDVERNVQMIVLFFTVIVAGFNIVAIFSLMVRAKVKDIGILQSIGATRQGVRSIFLRAGVLAGTIGAVIGTLHGIVISLFLNEILANIGVVPIYIGAVLVLIGLRCSKIVSIVLLSLGSVIILSGVVMMLQHVGIVLFPPDVYYLDAIPVELDPRAIVTIVLSTMALSFLFSVVPARQAAKLDPIEAIRYE